MTTSLPIGDILPQFQKKITVIFRTLAWHNKTLRLPLLLLDCTLPKRSRTDSIYHKLFDINTREFWPSTLAVPRQLSNGAGENVGHSLADSGTDFWALFTASATLWLLAKSLLKKNAGHTYCRSPVFDCSWYIKQCLFAFYLEMVNSMATSWFADFIMFHKKRTSLDPIHAHYGCNWR